MSKKPLEMIFSSKQLSRLRNDLKIPKAAKVAELKFEQVEKLFKFIINNKHQVKLTPVLGYFHYLSRRNKKIEKVHRTRVSIKR